MKTIIDEEKRKKIGLIFTIIFGAFMFPFIISTVTKSALIHFVYWPLIFVAAGFFLYMYIKKEITNNKIVNAEYRINLK